MQPIIFLVEDHGVPLLERRPRELTRREAADLAARTAGAALPPEWFTDARRKIGDSAYLTPGRLHAFAGTPHWSVLDDNYDWLDPAKWVPACRAKLKELRDSGAPEWVVGQVEVVLADWDSAQAPEG